MRQITLLATLALTLAACAQRQPEVETGDVEPTDTVIGDTVVTPPPVDTAMIPPPGDTTVLPPPLDTLLADTTTAPPTDTTLMPPIDTGVPPVDPGMTGDTITLSDTAGMMTDTEMLEMGDTVTSESAQVQ